VGRTKSGPKKKGEKNPDRRNGKAWKKNPGVSAKAHNGKTENGYSVLFRVDKASNGASA
jgi:hypothetical protein